MNKDKLIALLEDGACFNWHESKIIHPSFRKGWRTLNSSNISWHAVKRVHGIFGTNRLIEDNGVYTLAIDPVKFMQDHFQIVHIG